MRGVFGGNRAAPIARAVHALLRVEHAKRASLDVALLVGLAEQHDRDRVELYAGDVRAVVDDLRARLDFAQRQVAMATSVRPEANLAPMVITSRRLPRDVADRLRTALSGAVRNRRPLTGSAR